MRWNKILLFFVVYSVAMTCLAESWTITKAPNNAQAKKAAKISNDSGDILYLWRSFNEEGVHLYGELQLAGDKTFSNKTPRYQIDQGLLIKLNRIPLEPFKSKEGWLRITEKMATWKLYEATETELSEEEPFYHWLVGERLRFIYFDLNGIEKTIEFSLTDSTKSIASVTGISTE